MNGKLVTAAEYAAMKGIKRQTVYKQAKSGKLSAYVVNQGGKMLINLEAMAAEATTVNHGDNQGDSFVNQATTMATEKATKTAETVNRATVLSTDGDSFVNLEGDKGDNSVNQGDNQGDTERAALAALQDTIKELRVSLEEARADKAELQRQLAEQRAFYDERLRRADEQLHAMAVNMNAQLQALKPRTLGEKIRALLGNGNRE